MMMVAKQILKDEELEDISNYVKQDIESVKDTFEDRQVIGNRNLEWYANRQWTDMEIAAHAKQNRIPYVFNEIQHKVDHLCGTQTQTRMDSKCLAREQGDEESAQLLTHIVKWVEQINDLEYVESEIFKDALIKGFGAVVVYWQMDDVEGGYPKIEKIPFNELYWDGSAKKMNLEDARWMARVMKMSRLEAVEQFPEYADVISELSSDTYWGGISGFSVPTRRQESFSGTYYRNNSRGRDMLEVVEYYERVKIFRYVIEDGIRGEESHFDSKREAYDYFDGLVESYTAEGIGITASDGTQIVTVTTHTLNQILQSVLIQSEVIEHNLLAIRDFPFVVNFGYFADGDYWAFVDSLISPQMQINRSFSQWDFSLGTSSKNAIMVIESALRRGYSMNDLRRDWSSTSPVIPVNNHQAIMQLPNQAVNPELFNSINFAIQRMNDYAGGKNALGLQESAAESGRAVIARAEQGGLARLPLFDNLRYWRQQLTLRLVWWIKNYMTPNQIFRIIGSDKDIRYVALDDGQMDTLRELKMDVIIDEAVKSESVRERQFQQLKELFAVMPGIPPEVMVTIMLPFSTIPESKKTEILSSIKFYEEYQQKQAQMQEEQKLQQDVQMAVRKSQLRKSIEEGEQLEEQKKDNEKVSDKANTELNDVEKMRMQMGSESANSLQSQMQQAGALETPEEIRNGMAANLTGRR